MTKVVEYSGTVVNEKFIPVLNPSQLSFKPELKKPWEDAKDSIIKYVSGEVKLAVIDESIATGTQDTEVAKAWISNMIAAKPDYIALDSETSGLYPRNGHMIGISLSYTGKDGIYIDTDCFDEEIEMMLKYAFSSTKVIFHNAKFDMAFFEYHFGFEFPDFEDTMLLHYLIDENPGGHGLKQLSLKFTPYGDYEKPMYDWIDEYKRSNRLNQSNFSWDMIPFDIMKTYAAMDAVCTYLLYEKFSVVIERNSNLKRVYDEILIPGCRFLMEAQDNGVPFDPQRLLKSQSLMQEEIDAAINQLYEVEAVREFEKAQEKEFNPNSTVQLRSLLFDYIGLKPTGKETGTGAHSTDAEVLQLLGKEHDVPRYILNIRQKSKIKNTYLDKIIPQLDRDRRLRTNFNLHGTTSGRLSSSGKLNMQQLPRDNPIVKGCIRAKEGNKIVAMDLTTAEVYVAAKLAEDEALMDVFRSGGNFHSSIAKTVFKLPCDVEDVAEFYGTQRQSAKAVTFGIMYGAGPSKISQQVTKDSGEYFSVSEAKAVIRDYFRTFHRLEKWIETNQKFIKKHGFIYSFFGRKRRLHEAKDDSSATPGQRNHSIRSGLNFLIQSTASDINLLGAIDTHKTIKQRNMKSRIFALVHDSILAEVPENEVEEYSAILTKFIQMDRGVSIPGAPIGCDFDVHDDYSLGKFEKMYGDYA